jgi:hypothetical protein
MAPPETAYRLPWATLLRRVFLVDALDCPRCHGRMRIVAAVMEATVVECILRHLGHEPRAPTLAPSRAPPERDLAVEEPPTALRSPLQTQVRLHSSRRLR